MSKKDNIIIALRNNHIVIKDKINDKKYKIILSGAEGIELKVGQITFRMKDGSMNGLLELHEDLIMEDIIKCSIELNGGLPLYKWR